MTWSLILAVADNDVIGRDQDLPWRLPEDLKRFKRLTMGHPIVMGRKTYDSIGRPLPGRTTIVLTRDRTFTAPEEVRVTHSMDEARTAAAAAPGSDEVFVIGGAALFREALPICGRLLVTRVQAAVPGDVHFPLGDLDGWTLVHEEHHAADDRHEHPFTFQEYRRTTG